MGVASEADGLAAVLAPPGEDLRVQGDLGVDFSPNGRVVPLDRQRPRAYSGAGSTPVVTQGRATRAMSASVARANASSFRKCLAIVSPTRLLTISTACGWAPLG